MPSPARSHRFLRIGAIALVALLAVAFLVPWEELLRRKIEQVASEKTQRTVKVGGLDLHWKLPLGVTVRDVSVSNPDWAESRLLFEAKAASARIRLWPLIARREIVLPSVELDTPRVFLEKRGERRTWAVGDGDQEGGVQPEVGRLAIRDGLIRYVEKARETAVDVRVGTKPDNEASPPLPAGDRLQARATGRFLGETVDLLADGGPVLSLRDDETPYPLFVKGKAGATEVEARGTFTRATEAPVVDIRLALAGPSLATLGEVFDAAVPGTPPYRLRGHLTWKDAALRWEDLDGRIGDSDLAGFVAWQPAGDDRPRPMLTAELSSKKLDFDDLGPLLGAPAKVGPPGQAKRLPPPKPPPGKRPDPPPAPDKVLPAKGFDSERWRKFDARVKLDGKRVLHAPALPIDSFSASLALTDGVVKVSPLRLGVAGGTVDATLALDGRNAPIAGELDARFRNVQLQRLFPTLKKMENSMGALNGEVDLKGRGGSVSALLDSADGDMRLAMTGGRISNLIIEAAGLDGGELIKYLGGRDREIRIRCAVADLGIKDGVASTRTLLLDTTDSNVRGEGTVDFGKERIDLTFHVRPKDRSILSLRAPLHVDGPLKKPSIRPDAGVLAGKGLAALALAAINPLLALLPTIETGPGEDVDCRKVLAGAPDWTRDEATKAGGPPPGGAPLPVSPRGSQPPAPVIDGSDPAVRRQRDRG